MDIDFPSSINEHGVIRLHVLGVALVRAVRWLLVDDVIYIEDLSLYIFLIQTAETADAEKEEEVNAVGASGETVTADLNANYSAPNKKKL